MAFKDPEKERQRKLKYYQSHKESEKARSKAYKENHKDEVYQYQKNWRIKNKDRLNSLERERRKSDLEYLITRSLRSRIHSAIKRNSKSKKTLELLGCDIHFFIEYISNQFQEGMNWNNYGLYGWHVDHIIPCVSFDLTKEEDQKKCFHYTNLQPLWAKDNLIKGSSLIV